MYFFQEHKQENSQSLRTTQASNHTCEFVSQNAHRPFARESKIGVEAKCFWKRKNSQSCSAKTVV